MLSITDIQFSISGNRILNGISFDVPDGQTLGLIGPNGSGKTTLFNCISGFARPDSGSIRFNDEELIAMPAHRRAELGIGRVFQNFGVFRDMTVLENVLTAVESRDSALKTLLPWGSVTKRNREQARKHLAEVGLEDRADAKAGSLSGGQMRLLEIVRTLAYGADLFLLDEPTAGVAPKMKSDVAELIQKLQKLGKTVLIIEHDINFIQEFCDRIIVLDLGAVVLDGEPSVVRHDPKLQEIYFGQG